MELEQHYEEREVIEFTMIEEANAIAEMQKCFLFKVKVGTLVSLEL